MKTKAAAFPATSNDQGKRMKSTVYGALVGAVVSALAVAGLGIGAEARAQRGAAIDAGSELITVSAMVGDRQQFQQLTVIDPRSRVMSVYHVELASGAITLKSVRNISWDLLLREFNGVNPLPGEIRALLDAR
jgi:hypothetical protein